MLETLYQSRIYVSNKLNYVWYIQICDIYIMPNVNKIKNITSDCFFITKENGGLLVQSEECESNFENTNFYSNTEYKC